VVGPPSQPKAAKRVAFSHTAKEGTMKRTWNRLLEVLIWIRVGQELGSDTELAQNVAAAVDSCIRMLGFFLS
jgi:hypothetical protein